MTELVTREKPKERSGGRAFAFLAEPFKKSVPEGCPSGLVDVRRHAVVGVFGVLSLSLSLSLTQRTPFLLVLLFFSFIFYCLVSLCWLVSIFW
jgi:hypothetical protein